jgi:ferrochelatase
MEKIVQSARAKYELIGGRSPIVDIAHNICSGLQDALDQIDGGEGVHHVQAGMMFSEPFLEAGLKRLADLGCERIIFLSMTAYESWAAWEGPYQRVCVAAENLGIKEVLRAPVFGGDDAYLQAHADLLAKALRDCEELRDTSLSYVAHSLPLEDLHEMADSYRGQLEKASHCVDRTVKDLLGRELPASALSYVSLGARGGDWLRPSLKEHMQSLASSGTKTILVCPLGFATDHMEVLYDLDIAAAKEAKGLGLRFVRTQTLATEEALHPALIEALIVSVQAAVRKSAF